MHLKHANNQHQIQLNASLQQHISHSHLRRVNAQQ
jgi:hypothetical protein